MIKLRMGRGWRSGLVLSSLAAGMALTNAPHAPSIQAQEQAAQPGLRGLLPDMAPQGLIEEDFLALGESWKEWAVGTAKDIETFYGQADLDVAGQKASLEALRKRQATMKKALGDARYAAIFQPLSALHGRLVRRTDVAQAILDTLEMDPMAARVSHLKSVGQDLAKAVGRLEQYLGGLNNGGAWMKFVKADELRNVSSGKDVPIELLSGVQARLDEARMQNDQQKDFIHRVPFTELRDALNDYVQLAGATGAGVDQKALRTALKELVDALESFEEGRSADSAQRARKAFSQVRTLAADGGDRIADALSSHYFNYNLRVVASETFLNKVAGGPQVNQGVVDDYVLEAKVDGYQTTSGHVTVDLQPSNSAVVFNMTFAGVSQTNTQGVTDQATVFTQGYHQFAATKSVVFDGDRFATTPGTMWVNASNNTVGARTELSGVPLLGGIVDDYAVSEARKRRPASEAIAASKLQARLLPEFDASVDAEFGKFSKQLENKIIPKLHETSLFPSARSFRSTDSEAWISTRLMSDDELGADTPVFTATSSTGVAIHMHESLINNALDRLRLHGRSLTEDELAAELTTGLSSILGREVKAPARKEGETPDLTKFVFSKDDPIRVRLMDGVLTLVLQSGLQPVEGDAIPTQQISVPLSFSVVGTNIRIEAGAVGVAALEPGNNAAQIARAGVIRSKIQKALPTREVDRFISLKRSSGSPVDLAIVEILPNGGWLSLVIE